jgi:DNA-binding MarR family transcriptional regulator
MTTPDETIHQPVRLRIMAALAALPASAGGLDFSRLKNLTGATDGNLGAHIDTLSRAGYVTVDKAFVGRRPKTTVFISPAGRRAFDSHVAFLRAVIDGAAD